ncbi:MAG: M14 family zinc carboxypeptidase [Acidobacteriota bacterium]
MLPSFLPSQSRSLSCPTPSAVLDQRPSSRGEIRVPGARRERQRLTFGTCFLAVLLGGLGLAAGISIAPPAMADDGLFVIPQTRAPLAPQDILPTTVGADHDYDPAIPTPREVLGFEVGERHVYPHELLRYYEAVAAVSPRVSLELQGRVAGKPREGFSHEGRPLIVAAVTSERHQGQLETLRRIHLEDANSAAPVVVWLGYSVHGNEASGSNASLLSLYHLAASRSAEVEEWLQRAVVLLDPVLNPDGLARFAQWVNSHRGRVPVGDRWNREQREPWPRGRTNHYLYDLNRDWLLLQHPESRARIRTLRRWQPHLLGDFHEMGADATYFFQPGIPTRNNPLIPKQNYALTSRVAAHHAAALDEIGSLYYTEESFDDFYPGKGSTYPDLTGAVGVLFEQASARGHLRDDIDDGPLTFAFAVRNQLATSFSMIRGAVAEASALRQYRRDFYADARSLAATDSTAGWAFAFPGDPSRAGRLLEILLAHGIEVRQFSDTTVIDGQEVAAPEAYWVPVRQPQYRLAKAIFERRTQFEDSTFYDVSAWTFPLAFGALWEEVPKTDAGRLAVGGLVRGNPQLAGRTPSAATDGAGEPPVAWAFSWAPHDAPRALQRLLARGAQVRVATRPFRAETDAGARNFARGSVIVPRGLQSESVLRQLNDLWTTLAQEDGVAVYGLTSGLTPRGVDLGSRTIAPVPPVRPAILVDGSASSYGAGELWHLLDLHYGLPTVLLQQQDLRRADWDRLTHLLIPQGSYDDLPKESRAALRKFLRRGGTVVAIRDAATWAQDALLSSSEGSRQRGGEPEGMRQEPIQQHSDRPARRSEQAQGAEAPATSPLRPYEAYRHDRALDLVSGTLFAARIDPSHPLAYGYDRPEITLFRSGTRTLRPSQSPYQTPAVYTAEPLLAGYASADNIARIAGSPALVSHKVGEGQLYLFADAPSFRGFWLGTQRLLANALFFGSTLQGTDGSSRDAHSHHDHQH